MATLLDLLDSLLRDPAIKADYLASPDGFLADRGFGDLDSDDVAEALAHLAEAEPPGIGIRIGDADGLGELADLDPATIEDPFAEPDDTDAEATSDDESWLDDFDPDLEFDRADAASDDPDTEDTEEADGSNATMAHPPTDPTDDPTATSGAPSDLDSSPEHLDATTDVDGDDGSDAGHANLLDAEFDDADALAETTGSPAGVGTFGGSESDWSSEFDEPELDAADDGQLDDDLLDDVGDFDDFG